MPAIPVGTKLYRVTEKGMEEATIEMVIDESGNKVYLCQGRDGFIRLDLALWRKTMAEAHDEFKQKLRRDTATLLQELQILQQRLSAIHNLSLKAEAWTAVFVDKAAKLVVVHPKPTTGSDELVWTAVEAEDRVDVFVYQPGEGFFEKTHSAHTPKGLVVGENEVHIHRRGRTFMGWKLLVVNSPPVRAALRELLDSLFPPGGVETPYTVKELRAELNSENP